MASAPPAYSLAPSAPSSALAHTQPRQYHTPIYPTLNDYMGLDLSPETIAQNMPEYSVSAVPTSVSFLFLLLKSYDNIAFFCVLNVIVSYFSLSKMQLQHVTTPLAPATSGMVAPLSGQSLGLQRAHVTHGIREVIIYLSLLHFSGFCKLISCVI